VRRCRTMGAEPLRLPYFTRGAVANLPSSKWSQLGPATTILAGLNVVQGQSYSGCHPIYREGSLRTTRTSWGRVPNLRQDKIVERRKDVT
jgi:hypothetical protein